MKFLIIGLGSMGKRRIRNLQALQAGEVVGFDPRADRRAEVEKTYGIQTVAEAEAGFELQPDAAIISTPPHLHMPYAKLAAERGVHFFTEAGISDEGLEEVLALCAQQPGLVGVPSCTMRYFAGPRQILALLRDGAIGRPLSFVYHVGQWLPDWHPWEDYRTYYVSRKETGACREIVPFELTWLTHVFGPVDGVQAFKAKLSDLETDIDDIYQCTFHFETGLAGFLQMDVLARAPVRHFRLLGSDGTIEWDAIAEQVRVYRAERGEWQTFSLSPGTVASAYTSWSAEEPYIQEMRDFIAGVQGQQPFGHSYPEDSRILQVLRAAELSSDSGQRVNLLRIEADEKLELEELRAAPVPAVL